MYKEYTIHRGVFKSIEKGIYTYLLLNEKPPIDYIKIISVLNSSKPELWVKVVSVIEEGFRWKCSFVLESPPEKEPEKGFELNVKFDEWY